MGRGSAARERLGETALAHRAHSARRWWRSSTTWRRCAAATGCAVRTDRGGAASTTSSSASRSTARARWRSTPDGCYDQRVRGRLVLVTCEDWNGERLPEQRGGGMATPVAEFGDPAPGRYARQLRIQPVPRSQPGRSSGHAVRHLHRRRRDARPDDGPDADRARADQGDLAIAKKAEEVGLDVVRHRRAPQPAVHRLRADHDARLHRGADRADHPVDRDHADHHDRPGADRGELRQAPAPLRRPRRPDDGPRQHRPGLPVVRQGHPRRHPRWRSRTTTCCTGSGARTSWTGRASSVRRCRASPPRLGRWTAYPRSCGTARSAPPRSPSRRRTTATASSPTTSSGRRRTPSGWSTSTARRFEHYGHGTADQAIVGLGGQVFMRTQQPGRRPRVPPVLRQRPGLRPRPVAGGLHRADPADRRLAAAGHRAARWASASTSATTSASCS